MAEESVFRGVIGFLDQIGVYDVVLPLLLVFTIVFAILEKTKILGTEEIDGKKYTKKNLNAMTAFSISFLVVLSKFLVSLINTAVANITLLLLVSVCFLLLIGSFYKEDEDVFLEGGWRKFFMVLMFIGVVFIFLGSAGWIEPGAKWIADHWDTNWIGSIILVIIVIILMVYITNDRSAPAKSVKKEE
ncbi:MAG: hypothetical protein KJ709_03345 [Nanoarchaeota archaeon]|nr:hypothetical protein [Nanoarchaeota archaeon]